MTTIRGAQFDGPRLLGPYRLAVGLLACCSLLLAGCSTLSSLGLPVSTGPHHLLWDAEKFRREAGYPLEMPRELAKTVLPEYVVEPGDILLVEPANFNSPLRLTGGDQTVQPDGSIELGRLGRLKVAGKTVEAIEDEVQALAEATMEEDPGPLVVRLLRWDSKVYYVLGEVNSPGAYPYIGRETILDAIVAGGDLTQRANRHKVIISRPSHPEDCRVVLPVCYNHIVQLGDTSTNYQVLPGDRIYVESMTFWDDLAQTFFPFQFQKCPQCGVDQRACFVAKCDEPGLCQRGLCRAGCHAGRLPTPPRLSGRNSAPTELGPGETVIDDRPVHVSRP